MYTQNFYNGEMLVLALLHHINYATQNQLRVLADAFADAFADVHKTK